MRKILVVDFGGIGDLVLAIPFLRGLKGAFPAAEIFLLCAARAGGILKGSPYVDKLFLSPLTPIALFKTGLKLRQMVFDLAINLMPMSTLGAAIKMFFFFFLINARQWVGRDSEGRGFFYDIRVSEPEMQREDEVALYGRIFKAITGGELDGRLEFHITEEGRREAEALLARERRFPQYPLVLVNPGSDWPSRRWPIDRYAEVVVRLGTLFTEVEFGVIGSENERSLGEFIKEKVGNRAFILSGKTSLDVLPAVIEKATLLLTNDSGPGHLAKAIGTPVVILVGPSHPAYLGTKDRAVVIHHPISCSPCLRFSCDKMACWEEISVDEVVEAIKGLLQRVLDERDR